eukprot:CAMPEP_0181105798 /NCGR_PEP_ID=MMETSP1071-20121207/16182_1 /TAXON_ID=35127 /ORGANISM="Thalassiosira sp., Strain NH16" /LENGTH=379 /DNA_ID=CAMNT_0023189145 /DNA_START=37 /DNA_END=1177 /DNA_ORIENTATION=-
MQSYRDQSRPPPSGRHGHGDGYYASTSARSSGEGSSAPRRYNDNDNNNNNNGRRDHGHDDCPIQSSSRWEPPKARVRKSPSGPAVAFGSKVDTSPLMPRRMEIDNDCRQGGGGGGGNYHQGQAGGGKIMNRHNKQWNHRSNDAHNHYGRRGDPYRPQQHSRPKKNIITPDEETSAASSSSPKQSASSSNNNNNDDIPKLDPSDPTHARRIRQRRRQVLFGKNTAGYEEYAKKVPRHKRRRRSPDCPMTPDHTLDIPARRWQGLMNAWRRELHRFDPPDLHLRQPAQTTITLAPRPCVTDADRQEEEITQAKAAGLQVAFGSMNVGMMAGMFATRVADDEDEMARPGDVDGGAAATGVDEGADGGFLEEGCDTDSDDDLL